MRNSEQQNAILVDSSGSAVPLKGVAAKVILRDMLAEVTVEQRYRNEGHHNVEAVYTFPLPMGAVLLAFDVELGGKKLAGQVVARAQAERDYEDAMTDGDTAIMLEESGPGLYTVNVGNLLAHDEAVVRYRYGLKMSWQGKRLRFLMPTTIAPRYGDAIAAGLQPHQTPESSLMIEYPFALTIDVEGKLAEAALSSSTHQIRCHRTETGMQVGLDGAAVLDRDFVLMLESNQGQSSCIVTPDGEAYVAMAVMRIPESQQAERRAIGVKIVIDCSGSMNGTSIAQARKATLEILNQLQPQDQFNITLFGSHHRHLFPKMVPPTGRYLGEAWSQMEALSADMGGTEMETALASVFRLDCGESDAQVLLITDGEIHEHEKLVRTAEKSGHRIFTVGVGAAVAETFLKNLSAKTGGACELVAPQEGMDERVLMQFHRMRQPKLSPCQVTWPAEPSWTTPLPATVFAGDTVHVFAGFHQAITGETVLTVSEGEQPMTVAASMQPVVEADLPRMAVFERLSSLGNAPAAALAVKYQLVSRWTNYLIVAEREAKADELPELQKVPQMMAAGYGGLGHRARPISKPQDNLYPGVLRSRCSPARSEFRFSIAASSDMPHSLDEIQRVRDETRERIRQIEAKALRKLRHPSRANKLHQFLAPSDSSDINALRPFDFFNELNSRIGTGGEKSPATIDALNAWPLPSEITDGLFALVADGFDEAAVVACFLYAL